MADTNLDILIRAVLDAKGFDDLQGRLKQAETQTQATSAGAKDLSASIMDVGGKFLAAAGLTIGLAEAVSFLKTSFRDMVEESRLVNQFTAANEVLGKQIGKNTEANEAWLLSLELASGKTKEELIPSYIRLVAVTGDVAEAQRLAQIAALAAKAGLADVAQATQSLIRYYETGQTQTRGFGAVLKALAGDAKDTSTGLQNVEKAVTHMASEVRNSGTELDQARVRWQETKEAVLRMGEALVFYLQPALKILSDGIVIANEVVQKFRAQLEGAAFAATETFRALKKAATGDLAGAKEIIDGIGEGIDLILQNGIWRAEKFSKEIAAIWDKTSNKLNEEGGPFHPPPQAGAALDALKKKYEDLANNAVKWGMEEVEARLAVLKVYQQMANDPAVAKFPDLQAEANKRLVVSVNALGKAVAIEAAGEVADAKKREKADDDAFASWMQNETKRIQTWRKDKDLEVKEAIDAYRIQHKQDGDYTVGFLRFLEQQLAAFAGTETEKRNLARETSRIRVGLLMAERAAANDAANNAVTQAGELFGIQKEVSIANALVHTYAGAARALEDYAWPYDMIVAALVIAAGLAQVANIEKTGVGTGSFTGFGASTGGGGTFGFDDPQNDFAAVAGGRKWAKDMIGFYGQGAAAGFSEGMMRGGGGGSSSVVNNTTRWGDRHITVNLNAGMGTDRVQLMRFVKNDLVPVLNRYDQQRTLR